MKEDVFKLDRWQKAVLAHEGCITIRSGRQVGKSTVISMKAADFAIKHPGTVTLVIAASQRQSSLLFDKIRGEIDLAVDKKLVKYEEEPTLTKIKLKNKSVIYSLPAGRTGYFIRGFTVDLLIADEAAYIPEEVWRAVIPMVAVSRKLRGLGWIILLSTPFGKGGYYYESFHDDDFKQFHISSEECPRIPRDFLQKEKQRMSKQEYAQEYLGEFIDEFNQFFPTALIKRCMTFMEWDYNKDYRPGKKYYMGVDIARYGGDENAFVIAEMKDNGGLKIVKALTTSRIALTDTMGRIKELHKRYNFRRIFIDDAGVGGGVMDVLLEDGEIRRLVVGLNNAKRSIDRADRKKAIFKEDLYSNALILMEAGRVEIISDLLLLKSLKSMTFEYTSERNVKIAGQYSHLSEAFVRVCWATRDKGLSVFLA